MVLMASVSFASPSASIFSGVLTVLNKRRGRLVDALVGGLGRQHHRHQQGVGIDVLQLGLGFGIVLFQPREELFDFGACEKAWALKAQNIRHRIKPRLLAMSPFAPPSARHGRRSNGLRRNGTA